MKKIAFICITTLLCLASFKISNAQGNKKKTSGEVSAKNDEQVIMSILYQQQSAEYRALCLQAYNIARRKIED
ncbi:MAG TPA: hypothetical protein VIH86_02915, partial [Puia sp.]